MAKRVIPRRSRGRVRMMLVTGALPVQIPALWALSRLTGRPEAVIPVAALMSALFLTFVETPFDDRDRGPVPRLLVVRPFFVWWGACMLFLLVGPLALFGGWLLGAAGHDPALWAGLGVSLFGSLGGTLAGPRLRRVEVEVPGLPAALDGYRIAQLSDIHCGTFTPPRQVARWVARLNALEADLVAVTGDLITHGDGYVDAIAEVLATLRGRDGVYLCMGNHDYFTDGEGFARTLAEAGLRVLRNEGLVLEREGASLFVAGVDDTWTGRADVEVALAARPAGMHALLLAHDPNLFPQAAAAGVTLTLSGHTHGGQLALPLGHELSRRYTLARLITRFTAGLYRNGEAALYVSRGAGFTGPPVRIGAPSELTLLTLRAVEAA